MGTDVQSGNVHEVNCPHCKKPFTATLRRRTLSSIGAEGRPLSGRSSYRECVGESFEVQCPHCRKTFAAQLLEGAASRYRGFKCPHCRLFVPLDRASDAPLSRDAD